MDEPQVLEERLARCVALAKAVVIASFDSNLEETRRKAVEAFWAVKELHEALPSLIQQITGCNHFKTGDD